jgi:hypothetical protein
VVDSAFGQVTPLVEVVTKLPEEPNIQEVFEYAIDQTILMLLVSLNTGFIVLAILGKIFDKKNALVWSLTNDQPALPDRFSLAYSTENAKTPRKVAGGIELM